MGRLRSLATPARPLRLGGIPSQSPSEGGCRGTECCPLFLQHLSPPVGACGERNYALFFAAFSIKKQSRNSDLASKNSHSSYFFSSKTGRCRNSPNLANDDTATKRAQFDQNRATATTHQIW